MQNARVLGNFIQKLAEENHLSVTDLSHLLSCVEHQVKSLLKGRSFASFEQISKLAEQFNVSVQQLLEGDLEHYNRTVAHCMNQFQKAEHREEILDILDDYLDIIDAVSE